MSDSFTIGYGRIEGKYDIINGQGVRIWDLRGYIYLYGRDISPPLRMKDVVTFTYGEQFVENLQRIEKDDLPPDIRECL